MADAEQQTDEAGAQIAPPGSYRLDGNASRLGFRAKKLWWHPTGRFKDVDGRLEVAEGGETRLEGRARAESVDTGIPPRDMHLRTGHYLAAKEHPEITFRSTGIQPAGDERWEVEGELTVRDTTKPVTLPTRRERAGDGVRLYGEATIDRRDFGVDPGDMMTMGGNMPGYEIELQLDATFVPER